MNSLDDNFIKEKLYSFLPRLTEILGIPELILKGKLRNIKLLRSNEINGSISTVDNGNTYNIEITWGLCIFIHKMTKLFICRVAVGDDKLNVIEKPVISHEEMLNTAKTLTNSFWDESIFAVPSIPLSLMTKNQNLLCSYLIHFSELFCIAHELGHFIINSNPEKVSKELLIARKSTEDFTNCYLNSLKINNYKKLKAVEMWPNELASDLIGIKLCLNLEDNLVERVIVRAGAEIVFISMILLENIKEKRDGINFWPNYYESNNYSNYTEMDHPPTSLRLEFLQSFVDENFWQLNEDDLGKEFNNWKEYLLSKL